MWPELVPVVLIQVQSNLSLMHVHLFGAYFGLAVASRFPQAPPGLDKNRSSPQSELFSVLGESWAGVPQLGEETAGRTEGALGSFECEMQL